MFLAAAKRWREAEEQFHEAMRLHSTDSAPVVNLGSLLRDRSRLTEAEAAYRTALRLNENDGRIQYDLGLVLAGTNRPREAEDAFRRVATLELADLDILRALSEQLLKNGKPAEARTVLAQILAREPIDAPTRQQRARLQQKRRGRATEQYTDTSADNTYLDPRAKTSTRHCCRPRRLRVDPTHDSSSLIPECVASSQATVPCSGCPSSLDVCRCEEESRDQSFMNCAVSLWLSWLSILVTLSGTIPTAVLQNPEVPAVHNGQLAISQPPLQGGERVCTKPLSVTLECVLQETSRRAQAHPAARSALLCMLARHQQGCKQQWQLPALVSVARFFPQKIPSSSSPDDPVVS